MHEDFAKEDLLLVVEFLTHALPARRGGLPEQVSSLIEGARGLSDAEQRCSLFPTRERRNLRRSPPCGSVPWSVLSAGVDHETFVGQVEIAMANGASGVIAGRSLWKDCVSLNRAQQRDLLISKAVPRLKQIQAILERYPRNLQRAANG
jgi:tagatose 1,6-diphosphate aldolase